MADWGDYEGLEKYLNSKEDLNIKNQLLRPIYRELRTLIRNLSYTEEAKAYLDYTTLKNRIESYYVIFQGSQKKKTTKE